MNMDLRAQHLLFFDDGSGDMLGQDLDSWPGLQANLLQHLFQCVAETRHVYPGLGGVQVGIEIKARVKPLLMSLVANQDGFGDGHNARASQAHMYGWLAALN